MPRKKKNQPSDLELEFMHQIRVAQLPKPERELRFAAERVGSAPGMRERLKKYSLQDWRFDLAWREHKLAVELNGGNYVGGRHSNATQLTGEYRKINKAQQLGWVVLIFDRKLVESGEALRQLKIMLRLRR